MIRSHMLIGQDLSGEQVSKAFYNSTKNIKYLGKVWQNVKTMYNENNKTLLKEIKEDLNKQ